MRGGVREERFAERDQPLDMGALPGPSGGGPRMKPSWNSRSVESSSASASERAVAEAAKERSLADARLERDRVHRRGSDAVRANSFSAAARIR